MKRSEQRHVLNELRELLKLRDKIDDMQLQIEELSGVNWLLKGELDMIYEQLKGGEDDFDLNGGDPP